MASYRDALRRLQIIYNECAPQAKERRDAEKTLDDFTRLKKMLHIDVKNIRQWLKEREELLGVKPGSKEAAEMSHKIRSKIKQVREEAMKLQSMNKQEEKKKKQTPEDQEKIKNHEEIVNLVFKHIEEVEVLEKKRYNDKLATDRSALFAGAAPVKIDLTTFPGGRPNAPGADSNLPDIDNDPEVGRELLLLQEGNRDIDNDLQHIEKTVGTLKEIAINMDRELTKQNQMLEEVDKKVDKAQIHMDNVNVKMKNALDGVMKGDKFIVNCILICILLGLASFITSYFV